MKDYPLNKWHMAGRETLCFFFGHIWVISKTAPTKWRDSEEEAPYLVRVSSGNHMYEQLAWWSHKCTRCRLKVREGWPHQVWYKKVWAAIQGCVRTVSSSLTGEWKEMKDNDLSVGTRLVYVPLLSVAFGLMMFFAHFDEFPMFVSGAFGDLHYWFYLKAYKLKF